MREDLRYSEARDLLLSCAELEKSPGHVQVYKFTPISLWNAAAAGKSASAILTDLASLSAYPIPALVTQFIKSTMQRWGALKLVREGDLFVLEIVVKGLEASIAQDVDLRRYLAQPLGNARYVIEESARGELKLDMIAKGLPIEDLAGYCNGDDLFSERLPIEQLRRYTLREYQSEAAHSFIQKDKVSGGSGVIVLPCGAGKTIVGAEILISLQMKTLILVANVTAAKQWKHELMQKCNLPAEMIGEYHGQSKNIAPITIATYQILSKRDKKTERFEHLHLADSHNWGLIIYDEVHMLPAELFKLTSQLQAKRRLGLTATLVREDRKEPQVFGLIGPKRYDLPWKILEQQGWIAKARCIEIQVPMTRTEQALHDGAEKMHRFRIAAENSQKIGVVERLIKNHPDEKVLVIGTFVDHIRRIASALNWHVLDGSATQKQRELLFEKFRNGEIKGLVVSKIANTSIDLPDASMIVQVSGQFGSRQEEAQRLGRALRPKKGVNQALFYSLVSSNSAEEPFAFNRQLFLIEQGYDYEKVHASNYMSLEDQVVSVELPQSTTLSESRDLLPPLAGQDYSDEMIH